MERKTGKKEQTYAKILDSAAGDLRKNGLAGMSVGRVMKGAGLTVGGFYAHFPSKEALLKEILQKNLETSRDRLLEGLDGLSVEERLRMIVKRYLSIIHRDNYESGCLVPVVLSELERGGDAEQQILAEVFESLIEEATQGEPTINGHDARRTIMGVFAACVGGLALARALGKSPLSEETLTATQEILLSYLSRTDA